MLFLSFIEFVCMKNVCLSLTIQRIDRAISVTFVSICVSIGVCSYIYIYVCTSSCQNWHFYDGVRVYKSNCFQKKEESK